MSSWEILSLAWLVVVYWILLFSSFLVNAQVLGVSREKFRNLLIPRISEKDLKNTHTPHNFYTWLVNLYIFAQYWEGVSPISSCFQFWGHCDSWCYVPTSMPGTLWNFAMVSVGMNLSTEWPRVDTHFSKYSISFLLISSFLLSLSKNSDCHFKYLQNVLFWVRG